ncbi:thermonuclease [Naegleria gruberi]|uniref:Thermonuclease n=1 Tax=Naegleria gruberi TaxID=5762 RepID=D2V4L9_NAEGR|nr:thermonuclease [Naegleria gruberi]EFC48124.1 thermonuclease [Naegleria gruberi]|eukprot:XP_002680868.1 thermonuclease [Naegleria gruberi]
MKNIRVLRVVDGDTIICKMRDGEKERIRLIGVDTPETVHPKKKKEYYGQAASDYTKQVLENASIILEFENELRDGYGRLLAHVWVGGNNFQKMLLEGGYARAVFYHPNVKYQSEYKQYETSARNRGIGLWKQ